MVSDWQEASLGDLIHVKHGYAFSGKYIREDPVGDVLLTPGNFSVGGGFRGDKFKYYDGPVSNEFVLSEGDLLVTMTDLSKQSDTLGYPAFVPPVRNGHRYLHNQRLGKVVVRDGSLLDRRFLHYLLRSEAYRHEVMASATGTTVKHTSPTRIGRFRFLRPPLYEQRAIALILDSLDDKVELNQRMSETLEQIAREFYKAWFVDVDGVKDFEASEHGLVPLEWRVSTLGDVVSAVGGSTPSTREPKYWNDGKIAWATPKDLSGHTSLMLLDTARHISQAGLRRISSGLLPAGTFLFSSRAPIGYAALVGRPTAVNQGFIAIPPGGELSPVFMYFWTHFNIDVIRSRAGGSTFAEISKRAFRQIEIAVPPSALRNRFDKLAGNIVGRIKSAAVETTLLMEARNTLLPRLISGELRIPDAERIVSEVT